MYAQSGWRTGQPGSAGHAQLSIKEPDPVLADEIGAVGVRSPRGTEEQARRGPDPVSSRCLPLTLTQHTQYDSTRGPEGRRSGRPPFFDRTGMSCRKIPARVTVRQRFGHRPFLLVTFLWASKEKLPGRRRRTEALLLADTRKAGHARLSTKLSLTPFSNCPGEPKSGRKPCFSEKRERRGMLTSPRNCP